MRHAEAAVGRTAEPVRRHRHAGSGCRAMPRRHVRPDRRCRAPTTLRRQRPRSSSPSPVSDAHRRHRRPAAVRHSRLCPRSRPPRDPADCARPAACGIGPTAAADAHPRRRSDRPAHWQSWPVGPRWTQADAATQWPMRGLGEAPHSPRARQRRACVAGRRWPPQPRRTHLDRGEQHGAAAAPRQCRARAARVSSPRRGQVRTSALAGRPRASPIASTSTDNPARTAAATIRCRRASATSWPDVITLRSQARARDRALEVLEGESILTNLDELRVRLDHVVRRTVEHQLALVHPDGPVTQLLDAAERMADEEHCPRG